jgi:lipopolysaccharide heptosyltransferase II
MTTPAIQALKNSVPGRKITLLAAPSGQAIARFIPEIDEVITFHVPWQGKASQGSQEAVTAMIDQLKSRQFDASVLFTVYSQNPLPTAMLCYMAGIPNIAGYCRENPYGLMSDWLPDSEPLYEIKHEVIRQLDLVKSLGATVTDEKLSLHIPPEAFRSLDQKLQERGIDVTKPWLLLHPGVSEVRRQYPAELFAEAAKELAETFGFQVVLTGVASEKPLTEQIAQAVGLKAFSLAGELSLEELLALIQRAPLLIANNTGPVHMAAALQTPVVVLYAATNPQHTPWQVPHKVLYFDVPEERRSKNVIIEYAYEKAFPQTPAMVAPQQIVEAAKELLISQE